MNENVIPYPHSGDWSNVAACCERNPKLFPVALNAACEEINHLRRQILILGGEPKGLFDSKRLTRAVFKKQKKAGVRYEFTQISSRNPV